MSPFQHGEVSSPTTALKPISTWAHYERFTHAALTQANNLTSRRISTKQIISRERRGDYWARPCR